MKALLEILVKPFKETETVAGYVVWAIIILVAARFEGLRGFLGAIALWYAWLNLREWWRAQ
jgi:hypothetical protein